jgi:hypothetical protein
VHQSHSFYANNNQPKSISKRQTMDSGQWDADKIGDAIPDMQSRKNNNEIYAGPFIRLPNSNFNSTDFE